MLVIRGKSGTQSEDLSIWFSWLFQVQEQHPPPLEIADKTSPSFSGLPAQPVGSVLEPPVRLSIRLRAQYTEPGNQNIRRKKPHPGGRGPRGQEHQSKEKAVTNN